MALHAFALTFGPLPGVTPPSGPGGDIRSGTPAIGWMKLHWADLTAQQRSAAERYVAAALLNDADPIAAGGGGRNGLTQPAPTAKDYDRCDDTAENNFDPAPAKVTAWAKFMIITLGDRLGIKLDPYQLRLCRAQKDPPPRVLSGDRVIVAHAGETVAQTFPGNLLACHISYFPNADNDQQREPTLVHELMHCFSSRMLTGRENTWTQIPPWVGEGLADWAAFDLYGKAANASVGAGWENYLTQRSDPLYLRTYDAIGFFQHLQDAGRGDLWTRIPAIVDSSVARDPPRTDNEAAFGTAVTDDRTAVMDTLPSGFLLDARRGTPLASGVGPWDIGGPRPYHRGTVSAGVVGNDQSPVSVQTVAWEMGGVRQVTLNADVVTVSIGSGTPVYGRFGPGADGDYTLADAVTRLFCARSGGCTCPKGTTPPPTPFTNIENGLANVAVTGGTQSAEVMLQGHSLEKICKRTPPSPIPPASRAGRVPTACPGANVVADKAPGDGWEFDGSVLPDKLVPRGSVTCGYTSRTPTQQVALFLVSEPEPEDADGTPAQIPGTDRAWFARGFLYVVAGGRTLGVSLITIAEPESTAVAIATHVLGLD
jgi:hypothetical protein